MGAGMLVQRSFGKKKQVSMVDFVTAKTFVSAMTETDRFAAVEHLARLAAEAGEVDPDEVVIAVLSRERAISGAMGHGLAIPHARLTQLSNPVVAVGLSKQGLEFDAGDGEPVHAIVLILTPARDGAQHLEILSSVARSFKDPLTASRLADNVSSLTELRAFLRVEAHADAGGH
jgi:mannitol/fructose-specific phosphotransferase system IIA component (Ntr-type)